MMMTASSASIPARTGHAPHEKRADRSIGAPKEGPHTEHRLKWSSIVAADRPTRTCFYDWPPPMVVDDSHSHSHAYSHSHS
eukprot:scaffold21936_cov50-Attheya_sp.AAC.2